MKTREPWLGLVAATGLVVMLLGEGWMDALGLTLAVVPLGYGLGRALWARGRQEERSR